jgi:hypothetical protein
MADGMTLIRAERGLQARLARGLGITTGAVAKWSRVPESRLIAVERISGIPRDKLRPDLYRGWKPRCIAKRVPA